MTHARSRVNGNLTPNFKNILHVIMNPQPCLIVPAPPLHQNKKQNCKYPEKSTLMRH